MSPLPLCLFVSVSLSITHSHSCLCSSGTVSVSEWAQVLESVLRLDLPWRTLRPHLTHLAPDGSVDYESCFEDMEVETPLPQVT